MTNEARKFQFPFLSKLRNRNHSPISNSSEGTAPLEISHHESLIQRVIENPLIQRVQEQRHMGATFENVNDGMFDLIYEVEEKFPKTVLGRGIEHVVCDISTSDSPIVFAYERRQILTPEMGEKLVLLNRMAHLLFRDFIPEVIDVITTADNLEGDITGAVREKVPPEEGFSSNDSWSFSWVQIACANYKIPLHFEFMGDNTRIIRNPSGLIEIYLDEIKEDTVFLWKTAEIGRYMDENPLGFTPAFSKEEKERAREYITRLQELQAA